MYNLKEIPLYDRPRERLLKVGPGGLSDVELFSILLSSGTKKASVTEIARNLVMKYPNCSGLNEITVNELMNMDGIGKVKAIKILACIELGRRINNPTNSSVIINGSKDAYLFLKDELQNLTQETFVCLYLNTKGQVILKKTISIGGLTHANIDPRDVLKWAIKSSSYAIILSHNHPSGDPTPSHQDIDVTNKLIEASKLFGIMICDHIIIGKNCYFSFMEKKLINR